MQGGYDAESEKCDLGSFQSAPADLSSLESVEHKKELLEQLFLLLSTRTPLTFVVHILPGCRVVGRPALPAISSISARYHGADSRLSNARVAAGEIQRIATADAAEPCSKGWGCNC
jgi:hypothetical protein